MQLPKYKKKKRIKLKVCQEPGCGREFWGHPIAKYCELHRDIKQRQKQKKDVDNIESKNIIFPSSAASKAATRRSPSACSRSSTSTPVFATNTATTSSAQTSCASCRSSKTTNFLNFS